MSQWLTVIVIRKVDLYFECFGGPEKGRLGRFVESG